MPPERSAQRRRAILDATLTLFGADGPDALSIEAIGDRSNASVGSIYHHFGNKQGVLAALHTELLERYRAAMLSRLESLHTAEHIVKALVIEHLHWTQDNPTAARYLHRMRRDPAVTTSDGALRQSTTALIRTLRQRLGSAVIELPAPVFVAIVLGPADHFARHWLNDRTSGLAPRDVSAELAAAAWRAVRATPKTSDGSRR